MTRYYRRKTDANQSAMVRQLQDCGYRVALTHRVGDGFPDVVVAGRYCGGGWVNLLVEIKDKGGRLTEAEREFFEQWPGPALVAYDVQDVIDWFQGEVSK